jgi:hypothetical protein
MNGNGPSHLLIAGKVRNESFEPSWWVTPSADMLPALRAAYRDASSNWWVRAITADGRVLAAAAARVTETAICFTDGRETRMTALLEVPAATATVAVGEAEREAYRRQVLPPAVVTFASDLGDRLERQQTNVKVKIAGEVPQHGAFLVLRWDAPRAAPEPLGLTPVIDNDPSLLVDLTHIPGGDECRLVAVYNDGIHTQTIQSHPLHLPPRPARAVMLIPEDGMIFGSNGVMPLRGEVAGDGDAAALEWLIDDQARANGSEGVVRGLSCGEHVVTLRLGQSSVSVKVRIKPFPGASDRVPAPPLPWRSRPLRVVGKASAGEADAKPRRS